MAIHHTSQHVVLQTGTCHLPFSDSLSYCQSMDEQASKDENHSAKSDTPGSLSIPKFPVAKSEETKFYQKVLLTVEKWFSLYGWPSGTNPMYIPHSFRSLKKPTNVLHYRSVVDMLEHLTGRMIPGIPMCQTFSKDIQQRTIQVLQQNEAILEFLRVQGACLCHIKPEYLLDIAEFKHWCSLQVSTYLHINKLLPQYSSKYLDCSFFDFWSLSKRSWTDVLMQIYKVLVLSRVPEDTLHEPLCPRDTEDALLDGSHALTSTIYSLRELHLLSWLNMNYQKMRKIVWEADRVPSSRWIVNFDLDFSDGLVLGALIAAHCPYLIRSHFQRMYTTPCNVPQILHNNIVVTQALNLLGLSLNIKVKNKNFVLFVCCRFFFFLKHLDVLFRWETWSTL
uniref:Cilia- and flagella-associated protein 47 domain-containing protein n=1 Tax=Poecilia reticulata TaxID=8081 RepID=A0A3P9PH62_POERE